MRIVIACRLVFGAVALLPQQAAAQFAEKKVLTLAIARKIVATAETEAARNHLAGVVAVVDDGGWPILIERMDHAAYTTSVELASGKARTAALFKKPSQALEDAIKHGRVAAVTAQDFVEMGCDSEKTNDGRLIGVLPDSVIVWVRAVRLTNPPAGTGTALSGSKSVPLLTHQVPDRTNERRSVA
jgi:glc operon protein GlcG